MKDITFKIVFKEETEAAVIDIVEEEEEEEEETTEEEEVAAVGWDGWQSLLDIQAILPAGIELPPPNPDPEYVPTPPVPSLAKVSSAGSTKIEFSEEVFEYPDLKSMQVPIFAGQPDDFRQL